MMQALSHRALTLTLMSFVSVVALESTSSPGRCSSEASCHHDHGNPPKPAKAHSLMQSGSSITPRHVNVLPLFDDEEEPAKLVSSTSQDDPAFYFAVCLDILIVLIVANGVKRYRNGDHLVAKQTRPSVINKKIVDASSVGALHAAVRGCDLAACAELLGKSSTPSARRLLAEQDFWGCAALHLACAEGSGNSVPLATLLLDRGAKVNAVDTWDQTPLHFAARAGSAEMCKLLICRGAAIDAADSDERTPLHIAALAGKEGACEVLLDHGATLQPMDDTDVPPLLSVLLVQRALQQLPRAAD